eukprot:Skav210244  [mRNA]  locus=scaffold1929:90749:91964:+ [translate_table: standard]
MASFGVPPDPARIASYFPGMSAKSFSPIGASVCYRESIMKENTARSDAFESFPQHINDSDCNSARGCLGWEASTPCTAAWAGRKAQLDVGFLPALNPRAAEVADMWRTSSWSDFRPRTVSTSLRRQRGLAETGGGEKKSAPEAMISDDF